MCLTLWQYGTATIANKNELIFGLTNNPEDTSHNTYNILASAYTCNTFHVVFRVTSPSTPGSFVTGLDFVIVEKGTHLIRKAYKEYNLVATLRANGYPECKQPFPIPQWQQ